MKFVSLEILDDSSDLNEVLGQRINSNKSFLTSGTVSCYHAVSTLSLAKRLTSHFFLS